MEEQPVIKKEQIETPSSEVSPPPPVVGTSRKFLFPILISVVIVFILGAIAWVGYQKSTTPKQPQQQPKKIYSGKVTIDYFVWPGYIGLIMAQKKGYFQKEGVNVQLQLYDYSIPVEDSRNPYLSGKIQGITNTNLDAVNQAIGGFDHQAVLLMDYSNGADGIIASSGITDISQIKGKKVAYGFGGLEEFFLTYVLNKYGMTLNDITSVDLTPEDAAQALIDKKVDVAVTYEPFLSSALKKNNINKLYSSAETPGLMLDILTFNKKFIDAYPDTMQAIVKAYFEGVAFVEKNPQEAYKILAQEYKTTPVDIENQLKTIKIENIQENKTAFTFSPGLESLYGNLRNVDTFLKANKNNTNKKDVDTDTIVNGTFINNLEN
jgi:NitT/TauT family transport system substrate-binding protein